MIELTQVRKTSMCPFNYANAVGARTFQLFVYGSMSKVFFSLRFDINPKHRING